MDLNVWIIHLAVSKSQIFLACLFLMATKLSGNPAVLLLHGTVLDRSHLESHVMLLDGVIQERLHIIGPDDVVKISAVPVLANTSMWNLAIKEVYFFVIRLIT